MLCQKAPSAKRCIKTILELLFIFVRHGDGQKAPSAKRCIKTWNCLPVAVHSPSVRKHRAPKGALRHEAAIVPTLVVVVDQKAPSAKRCIKTARRC